MHVVAGVVLGQDLGLGAQAGQQAALVLGNHQVQLHRIRQAELPDSIAQFVQACWEEGAPVWKVFWPQCHTERAFREHCSFGGSGFPFRSSEYANPESVDYSGVEVPNALWHETHTFTCFPFPSHSEEDSRQIAGAVVKVIQAYTK